MQLSPVTTPFLTALAAVSLASPGDSLRVGYAPEAGSRWQKTFEVTTDLAFDELSVVMDGQEIDSQFLPQIEMDSTDTVYLELIEELREVGEGRPRLVHRTYEEAWREADMTMEMIGMMPEPITSQGKGRSPLEGRTVAFLWPTGNADGEVERSWAEDGSEDTLLFGLEADMDLLAWLPEGEVEVGDSWTLPAHFMDSLLSPGGDLAIELEGENVEEFQRGEDAEHEYDGELTLRLAGLREDDGQRLAVIEIEGEFDTESEYPGDLEMVPVVDGTATNTDTIAYEFEGELVWDLQAGMLRSLEAQADIIIESHTVKDPGQEGGEYESTATLSGTMTFVVDVEPAD